MSKVNTRSKSSLFLMEIIIVLCFFSLSAAICMKVFASAKVKTDYARDLTNATYAAESLAESFKAEKLDGTMMTTVYPNATNYDGIFTVYYDADWTIAKEYDGAFRATLEEHEEENVSVAQIIVYDEAGEAIFDMVAAASPEKEAE